MHATSTSVALAALMMATTAAMIRAQAGPADLYAAAVNAYVRDGDVSRAILPLQAWKPQQFETAIRATIATHDPARIEAAAVFELELAVAFAGLSSSATQMHVELGKDLIDSELPALAQALKSEFEAFRMSWYAVAGSVFVATKDLVRARPLIEKTRDLAPQSPRAQTLMGSYYEADAGLLNPEDFQTLIQRDLIKRERMRLLARAEDHYRAALRYDQHYARALTRLGRVLHLNDHLPEAKTYLEQATREAKLPGDQYLAALFMGALQIEQNDLSSARASYERALTIMPASQTVMVALGHLEIMSGRPDRAQLLARRFAETPAEPWWGYKDGSFDMIGLQTLRARVVRR